jgi:hypothetical protein
MQCTRDAERCGCLSQITQCSCARVYEYVQCGILWPRVYKAERGDGLCARKSAHRRIWAVKDAGRVVCTSCTGKDHRSSENHIHDEISNFNMAHAFIILLYNVRVLTGSAAGGIPLDVCALRPAAIYGPGEQRHFPRICRLMDSGLFVFNIGSKSTRVDWVHIDNLVDAYTAVIAQVGHSMQRLPRTVQRV